MNGLKYKIGARQILIVCVTEVIVVRMIVYMANVVETLAKCQTSLTANALIRVIETQRDRIFSKYL